MGWQDATVSGPLRRGDTWGWPLTIEITGYLPSQEGLFTGTPLVQLQDMSGRVVASTEEGAEVPVSLGAVQGHAATDLSAGVLTFSVDDEHTWAIDASSVAPVVQVVWCGEPLTFKFPRVPVASGVSNG